MNDDQLMHRVFELATQARRAGSHPFATVVSLDRRVIIEQFDETAITGDPTGHPEIEAIRALCRSHDPIVLRKCTLYTNVEPCPMCAGAIHYSGIGRLVYSVSRGRFDELVAAHRGRGPKRYDGCRAIIEDGGITTIIGPFLEDDGIGVLQAHRFPPRWTLRFGTQTSVRRDV
jgi:tRNA(Arg) A34 adenosine deaminase TadA